MQVTLTGHGQVVIRPGDGPIRLSGGAADIRAVERQPGAHQATIGDIPARVALPTVGLGVPPTSRALVGL